MPVRPDGRNQREESFRRVGSWSQQVFRQDGDASPSRWAKSARRKFPPSGILVSTSFSTRWGCQSVPMGEISEKKVSAEWDLGLNKFFDKMGMPVKSAAPKANERAIAAVHANLWQRCADSEDDSRPMLVLADNIVMSRELGKNLKRFISVVEKVTKDPRDRVALVFLTVSAEPTEWCPQWLPTDLKASGGEPIVLREAPFVCGSAAYLIWPAGARQLVGTLPINAPLDLYIARHTYQ